MFVTYFVIFLNYLDLFCFLYAINMVWKGWIFVQYTYYTRTLINISFYFFVIPIYVRVFVIFSCFSFKHKYIVSAYFCLIVFLCFVISITKNVKKEKYNFFTHKKLIYYPSQKSSQWKKISYKFLYFPFFYLHKISTNTKYTYIGIFGNRFQNTQNR